MKIILASASPRRRELLSLLVKDFEIIAVNADESTIKTSPPDIVMDLALKKASAAAPFAKNSELIISADTLVFCNGRQLGKPRDANDAVEMLTELSSKTHSVYTGFCLMRGDEFILDYERTDVTFISLTQNEIKAYTETGEPFLDAREQDYPTNSTNEMIFKGWMDENGRWRTNNGNKPQCMDKAGAYAIQGYASRFISKIDGCYFNVVGLPISKLYRSLKCFCPSAIM